MGLFNDCLRSGFLTAALLFAAASHANEFDCLIEARQTVEIRSSVDAVIKSINVSRGDFVKKGDVLVTLESGAEQAALKLAQSRSSMQGEMNAARGFQRRPLKPARSAAREG